MQYFSYRHENVLLGWRVVSLTLVPQLLIISIHIMSYLNEAFFHIKKL